MTRELKAIWSRRFQLWFAMVGLFASSYLLYTYTTGAALRCGSLLHGCDVVRVSQWASLFGLPTPIFGVIFYLSILVLLGVRLFFPQYQTVLLRYGQMLFGVVGFIESAYLTFIQAFVIRSFCTWCLISAVAATGIFTVIWFDRHFAWDSYRHLRELKLMFISLASGLFIGAGMFYYLIQPSPAARTVPNLQPLIIQED